MRNLDHAQLALKNLFIILIFRPEQIAALRQQQQLSWPFFLRGLDVVDVALLLEVTAKKIHH